MAQALKVRRPKRCMASLIRKRGHMLPPTADMIMITKVESPPSWARLRVAVARTREKAAAAAAVTDVTMANPARWRASGRWNTTAPQVNMTVTCAAPSEEEPLPRQQSGHPHLRRQHALQSARLALFQERPRLSRAGEEQEQRVAAEVDPAGAHAARHQPR